MGRTENVELTVLCLIEDGDKILLQNRVKRDWQGYALPGGHVEPGESFVYAVIREMKEETGLTVIGPRLVGLKQFPIDNGRYVVLLFKATKWSGKLISSDEGGMEWIEYSRLPEINTVDDFDELLRVMNTPELASFWRLVRDPDYVSFLKDVGVGCVQLTFFGMEETTDRYVGRKGAFQELLEATEILLSAEISPRWQMKITHREKSVMIDSS